MTLHRRRILLNRMMSSSTTKVSEKTSVPLHNASELLEIIDKRRLANEGIEFFGMSMKEDMDREKDEKDHDSIRLIDLKIESGAKYQFVVMLFEFVRADQNKFPVVHRVTRVGREIEGEEDESAGYSSHVVIALPKPTGYDDKNYRCCIEYSSIITRRYIEAFLCRQLRRTAAVEEWSFQIVVQKGRGRPTQKNCRYWPKLELYADVSRKIAGGFGGKELSHMIFSKRSEKLDLAQETSVIQTDVFGEVTYKITAKQAPTDDLAKRGWVESLRESYELRGFTTRMYFKTRGGDILSGTVDNDADGAADLLMCPNEIIELGAAPPLWRAAVDPDTVEKMKELLDRDELWDRIK